MFKTPGLGLLLEQIASAQRWRILDLGAPRGSNIDYMSQYSCVLHFGGLPQTLAEDPAMSLEEHEERDVESAVERTIQCEDGVRFDVIFAWDLFDYLDATTVHTIMRRIGDYCRTGTVLYLMTSTGEQIPDEPGRYTIVDEQHLRFERLGMGTRNGMKYSPRGLERIMPGFHLLHSFLLGNEMQDYLFTHD